MERRVSFQPMYKVYKWEGSNGKPEKSWRENNKLKEKVDMREHHIEEELIQKHEIEYNDKELCINRLSQRDIVTTAKLNPHIMNTGYVNDITNHDMYLRPQYNKYQKQVANTVLGRRDLVKQKNANPFIEGDILKDLSDRKINNTDYVKIQENKYLKRE